MSEREGIYYVIIVCIYLALMYVLLCIDVFVYVRIYITII